jgi:hypothetical protein
MKERKKNRKRKTKKTDYKLMKSRKEKTNEI